MTIYTSGTARVTSGSTSVVGTNTSWALAAVAGGLFTMNGVAIPIASVESETSLTLAYVWPSASRSGVYSISLATAQAASTVEVLKRLQDNVAALRNLSPLGRALTAADTQEAMRRLLGVETGRFSVDASGLRSERSQYDGREVNFSFLATDEGLVYIKEAFGWSDGVPFGRGDDGREVVLRVAEGAIQWTYLGDPEWRVLVPLGALTGSDGRGVELRRTTTHVQWRPTDGDWSDLLLLEDLRGREAVSTTEAKAAAKTAADAAAKSTADAGATAIDRQAVATDRAAVAEDRRMVRADMEATTLLRTSAGLARDDVEAMANLVARDRGFVAENVSKTAIDREVVSDIRVLIEQRQVIVEAARAEVVAAETNVEAIEARVQEFDFSARGAAERAEAARDQAEAIVGPTTALGIRYDPFSTNRATNVQAALNFLTDNRASLIGGKIPRAELPDFTTAASDVSFTPFEGIDATTVQAAIFQVFNKASASAHTHPIVDITGLQGALDARAPLASPAFTGAPTAPTQAVGSNGTAIATTAFVRGLLTNGVNYGASWTVPTAAAGDDDTSIASTAFVQREIGTRIATKADLIGGKIPESQIPAVAIMDIFEAASQSDMLAVAAQRGDIVIRSDLNKTFILRAEPATTIDNWAELRTPTDAVLSVAGKTGAVVLTVDDVSGLQTALSAKANAANPTLTGTVTIPTPAVASSTTVAASTAFVRSLLTSGATYGATWTVPTAAAGANNTLIASTAFVMREIGSAGAGKADLVAGKVPEAQIPAIIATSAEIRAGNVDTKNVSPKTLTDAMIYSAVVPSAIDFSTFINGAVTLTANGTLAAPTNPREGMSGTIRIAQDATGGRTLGFNSFWNFGALGPPTIPTGANAVCYVLYQIDMDASRAICTFRGQ